MLSICYPNIHKAESLGWFRQCLRNMLHIYQVPVWKYSHYHTCYKLVDFGHNQIHILDINNRKLYIKAVNHLIWKDTFQSRITDIHCHHKRCILVSWRNQGKAQNPCTCRMVPRAHPCTPHSKSLDLNQPPNNDPHRILCMYLGPYTPNRKYRFWAQASSHSISHHLSRIYSCHILKVCTHQWLPHLWSHWKKGCWKRCNTCLWKESCIASKLICSSFCQACLFPTSASLSPLVAATAFLIVSIDFSTFWLS